MQPAATTLAMLDPPSVAVSGDAVPVKKITASDLRRLGDQLTNLFTQYRSDRRIAELRWLRNQRQYLGVWDPEVEREMNQNRSQAYPRLTRIKVISVVSRVMNLMFPGNEKNWTLKATPSPNVTIEDMQEAIRDAQTRDQESGAPPRPITLDLVNAALQALADKRAGMLEKEIEDQLEELGGDQTFDYVTLCRKAVFSGALYGLGVLRGPYAREIKKTTIALDARGQPTIKHGAKYMPQYEFLPIWDFYPDMSAKTFEQMDGYFTREVMSRAQVRELADRDDFFPEQIKTYLNGHPMGNYRPQPFETELRAMGVKVNVNEMKTETSKHEVIVWHGKVSGEFLRLAGVDVPQEKLADDIDAEVWMIDSNVIKADMNPWVKLGRDVKTLHTFLFDEDDTSPVGNGLPFIIRDSQMAVASASRMLMDNASVVCGPQLELNTELLRGDQDLTSITAYKIWYRDDDGLTTQYPAVRNVQVDSHLEELLKIIQLFMDFADKETFVGPATGGDMEKAPSEPMRTAAGASMLRGDAALPFKDIVRSFDRLTSSVILSLVEFNRLFNPDVAKEADINVIARGATSLIAKEVRGIQIDQLAQTLTDEEKVEVDMRKFARARLAVRDLEDLLKSEEDSSRDRKAQADAAAQAQQQNAAFTEANIRKLLSDAFKNITQGQKNSAAADAQSVDSALSLLEAGVNGANGNPQGEALPPAPGISGGSPQPGGAGGAPDSGAAAGVSQGAAG